jgi:hypothetical protein
MRKLTQVAVREHDPNSSGGHESPDVTLAYLKGKDDEVEDAQEHANSSSLALLLRKIDPLVALSVNPLSAARRQVAIGT